MFSIQDNQARYKYTHIVAGVLLLGVTFIPQIVSAATLNELVAKAKQEGSLDATVTSSLTGRTIEQLAATFKKRFGLDSKITLTPYSGEVSVPRAIAETRTGVVPTYDALEDVGTSVIALLGAGGIQQIDDWQLLLAEINPAVRSGKARPDQLSSAALRGFAFTYLTRLKALLYSPRLISSIELPKTHADLVDPKYKGKWSQPPWTTHWDAGPLVFPDLGRDKWLEIVRRAGKNAGAVLTEAASVQRVLLGEFAFTLANDHYAFAAKTKDPQAPLEITYFKDYNQANDVYYVVRKGTRHPATATLFALWMATPEAESIWQPVMFVTQTWGESDLDKKVRELIQNSGAKIVDLIVTEKGRDLLEWYGTEEGRKYTQAIGRAIRGE